MAGNDPRLTEPGYRRLRLQELELRPITLRAARRFVGEHHSHNLPPKAWLFGTSVVTAGELVGVAMAGRPNARHLDDGLAVEITRTCTVGTPNACSMLYGALAGAAKRLGYRVAWTYTLAEECAACVRAAGFRKDAEVPGADPRGWERSGRSWTNLDLFGERIPTDRAKVRWRRDLAPMHESDES